MPFSAQGRDTACPVSYLTPRWPEQSGPAPAPAMIFLPRGTHAYVNSLLTGPLLFPAHVAEYSLL